MPAPPHARVAFGRRAERYVAGRLERAGYQIVARNVRLGPLELDLVARRQRMVIFIEVRARSSTIWGHPAETLDRTKRRHIRAAASRWLREHAPGSSARIDVATVTLDGPGGRPRLSYFADAF